MCFVWLECIVPTTPLYVFLQVHLLTMMFGLNHYFYDHLCFSSPHPPLLAQVMRLSVAILLWFPSRCHPWSTPTSSPHPLPLPLPLIMRPCRL